MDKDYRGKNVTFRESFGFSKSNYGPMISSYFAGIAGVIPVALVVALLLRAPAQRHFTHLAPADIILIIISVVTVLLYVLGTAFVPFTVVSEKKKGFRALKTSFKYIYKGNFWGNLGRLAFAVLVIGVLIVLINWLSQLRLPSFSTLSARPRVPLKEPLWASR